MAERDVIVRCPGCGNGKVVAVAVGQLLQCDICRTAFHAPIADDDQVAPTAMTDSFVVGDPVAPADVPQEPVSTSASAASADSDSAVGDSGVKQTRSWRSHDLEVAPEHDDPDAVTPMPSVAPALESDSGEYSGEELDIGEPRGVIWTFVAMLAFGVILTVLVAATFYIVRALPQADNGSASTEPTSSDAQDQVLYRWTNAAKFSQRMGPMKLKVERVVFGALRARDLKNEVFTTEDDNLLGITVSALNEGQRARVFQNWYGHAFVADDGAELIARLTDDQGRDYALLKFDDVSQIEGQRLADQIDPQQSVQDTVVFMIPDDVDRTAIKYFHLTLPGAAVDLAEFFRFQIPASMIKGFDRRDKAEPDKGPAAEDAADA